VRTIKAALLLLCKRSSMEGAFGADHVWHEVQVLPGQSRCMDATWKKANGKKYYQYVLMSVDDILAVSATPKAIMQMLSVAYWLKENPDGTTYERPTRYVGADIGCHYFEDDAKKSWWTMLVDIYVKNTIKTARRARPEAENKGVSHCSTIRLSSWDGCLVGTECKGCTQIPRTDLHSLLDCWAW
jgi:hypothetical protein